MEIKKIEEATVKRYSDRFVKLGVDVKTLGWGSDQQQEYRFLQVIKNMKLEGKILLDIGCGFGDLNTLCKINGVNMKEYIGFDINPDLINTAKEKHPDSTFYLKNIFDEKSQEVADVGVMLGVLNFKLENNLAYTKKAIEKAFSFVKEALVVDFLSTELTPEYPKEDFVYYHDPKEILDFALTLTPNVKIVHDYKPIPQKEFMAVLSK